MNQPQVDPCASIVDEIASTQKRINDNREALAHSHSGLPDDELTDEERATLSREIHELELKKSHLNRDFDRCREDDPYSEAPQTVPSEAGREG